MEREAAHAAGHLQATDAATVWPFFLWLLTGIFLYARRWARYVVVREDWELDSVLQLAFCHGDGGLQLQWPHTQR
jgi:hypothetical protein